MTRLGDVLHDADPAVRALVVYGANPLASNPDTGQVRARPRARGPVHRRDRAGRRRTPSTTPTSCCPRRCRRSTWTCRTATATSTSPGTSPPWRRPASASPHTEILRRLARAMGLQEPASTTTTSRSRARWSESGDPTLEGITVERLRRDGWVRLGHPNPLVPFADGLPDAVGRLELQRLPRGRPVPGYTPPAEARGAGRGPARADRGRLALVPELDVRQRSRAAPARRAAPAVALHPDDAAARGLEDGDEVRVGNERGAFAARLAVGETRPAGRRRDHEGPLAEAARGRGERQRRGRGARRRPRRRRGVPRLLGVGPARPRRALRGRG